MERTDPHSRLEIPGTPGGQAGGGTAIPSSLSAAAPVGTDFGDRRLLERAINVASLALVDYGAVSSYGSREAGHLLVVIGLCLATAGWLSWLVGHHRAIRALAVPGLLAMGIGGGLITPFAPLGAVFIGVAAMGAIIARPFRMAVALALCGPVTLVIVAGIDHQAAGAVITGASGAIAGGAIGLSRRQALSAAARAAAVQLSEARAVAETARADLLDGRNQMARELHDVLAHTLSALSLQLEALDSVVAAQPGGATPAVAEQLARTKRLVRTGLGEARGAVRALRENAPPIGEQLTALAAERDVPFDLIGDERPVGPEAGLALYRVAQESLTNATKHAPGATAAVSLEFIPGLVVLTVIDGGGRQPTGDLSVSGGRYGITGMRERVLLLGGRLDAGPHAGGWRVRAEVPVP